jgi:hypothetical protein
MRSSAKGGRRRIALPAVVAIALALGALAGCGSDDEEPSGGPGQAAAEVGGSGENSVDEAGATPDESSGSAAGGPDESEGAPPEAAGLGTSLTPPPCPPDASKCAEASGQIVYVERVDPDGDGDAHFVLLSAESITGPGLTVIDVRPELRPSPLPEVGDELAASGPVFRGSYGQRQIQADAIRVGP